MQITYDTATKEIVIRIPYDDSRAYPVNPKTGKSRTVDATPGFLPLSGTAARVSVNVIQPLTKS